MFGSAVATTYCCSYSSAGSSALVKTVSILKVPLGLVCAALSCALNESAPESTTRRWQVVFSSQDRQRLSFRCSFVNVVETGKFPTAFGQLKHKADGRVFLVVRSRLERAVDLISAGFFFRFGVSKTLRGIRLTIENSL